MVTLDGGLLEIRVGVEVILGEVEPFKLIRFGAADARDQFQTKENTPRGGESDNGDDDKRHKLSAEMVAK